MTALKPLVEQATKSGALPVILGGDCTIALGTIAGLRRYYRAVSLIYLDRDADLNVPATSPSGRLDGMGVAHITGRGAPELVRFWGEPPLVREPEIALFGLDRIDRPEQAILDRAPIRRYTSADVQRRGPAVCAQEALERTHSTANAFLLHFDVDVISSEDLSAAQIPGAGGLRLEQVREALGVFAKASHLAAMEITEYNPESDADGAVARRLVEILVEALAARLAALTASAVPAEKPTPAEKPAEAAAAANASATPVPSSDAAVASSPLATEAASATEETPAPEAAPTAESSETPADSAGEPQSSGT
jgi:arginase